MSSLQAENWKQSPQVAQARALLHSALREAQMRLTGIRPPDPLRAEAFAARLKHFQELRGAALYFPYIASGFGRGPLVELLDGSVKYDFISGIGVHYFGHGSELMLDAAFDACLEDTLMQGNLQQGGDAEEVLGLFLEFANATGAQFAHGFLTSSGAMANENALKILFQKKFPARRVLAFEHNFAGRTLALSHITDKPAYRVGLPPAIAVDYLPYFDAADPQGSTQRALETLNEHLARHPGDHALLILELIQGEGGGYREGDSAFFKALLRRAREAKVGILFDEIQTFGRTDHAFAFQHFGLEEYAEVVTIGKLTQVCATLVTEAYKPGPGLVSQTFTAATAALKAGRAVLTEWKQAGWFGAQGRIVSLSNRFRARLQAAAQKHPDKVAGPFGLGAMVVCTPMGGDDKRAAAFLQALFHAGLIGFIAGSQPTRIRFLLPLGAVTERDIDAAADIFDSVAESFRG